MQMVAVEPFPESHLGNSYILVIGDNFTRRLEAFPITNQEATTVACVLINDVFYRFSSPEQLYYDQSKQLESVVVAIMCKFLEISKICTTPYHPQSDGLVNDSTEPSFLC